MATKRLKYVIVRTYSAGVHVGELAAHKGKEVTLKNARRVWSWHKRFTLNEIANSGVGDGSQLSDTVSEILLTEAIEIIDVKPEAANALKAYKVFKP